MVRPNQHQVLLEEYSRTDLRGAIQHFENGLQDHLRSFEARLALPEGLPRLLSEERAILRSDHAWFSVSLEQLEWLFRIVEGEDHGGHRQALGQYGRLLAEALQRHRDAERAYLAAVAGPVVEPRP